MRGLPIRCSGITDKDPIPDIEKNDKDEIIKKTDKFPIEGEKIEGGNEAIALAEKVNSTQMARLYVAALKTFEYDLAMNGNFSLMAEILEEKWPKKGSVRKRCKEIEDKGNVYSDPEEKREDAKFLYKHIDCDEVGKGIFSQAFISKLDGERTLIVPDYIKKAIIWACGGECD